MTAFKRILAILVVLNIVGWSAYAYERHSVVEQATSEDSARIAMAAAKFQKSKAMSAQDYTRWRLLLEQTEHTGVISDQDLRFMLDLMNAPSSYPPFIHLNGTFLFGVIKAYKPGQREAIYQAGIPLLASKDRNDKVAGLVILKNLGDPRAVPDVLPFLKDQDPKISKIATEYLNEVGYGNPASTRK